MTDQSKLDRIVQAAREPVIPDAAAAARVSDAIRGTRSRVHPLLAPRLSYAITMAGMIVAFVAGLLLRGADRVTPGVAAVPGPTPVTFVLVAEDARDVSVVGDFNDWTPGLTRLRQQTGGVWSVVVPMQPGRYSYAFIVDGSTWLPDPAAPRNAEEDFGRPSSIVLVERGAT